MRPGRARPSTSRCRVRTDQDAANLRIDGVKDERALHALLIDDGSKRIDGAIAHATSLLRSLAQGRAAERIIQKRLVWAKLAGKFLAPAHTSDGAPLQYYAVSRYNEFLTEQWDLRWIPRLSQVTLE